MSWTTLESEEFPRHLCFWNLFQIDYNTMNFVGAIEHMENFITYRSHHTHDLNQDQLQELFRFIFNTLRALLFKHLEGTKPITRRRYIELNTYIKTISTILSHITPAEIMICEDYHIQFALNPITTIIDVFIKTNFIKNFRNMDSVLEKNLVQISSEIVLNKISSYAKVIRGWAVSPNDANYLTFIVTDYDGRHENDNFIIRIVSNDKVFQKDSFDIREDLQAHNKADTKYSIEKY